MATIVKGLETPKATYNEDRGRRYIGTIDGVDWAHWIVGYCGRLWYTIDQPEPQYMTILNDGTRLRWLVGNYHGNRRFGVKPADAELLELASSNDPRPLMKGGPEYKPDRIATGKMTGAIS